MQDSTQKFPGRSPLFAPQRMSACNLRRMTQSARLAAWLPRAGSQQAQIDAVQHATLALKHVASQRGVVIAARVDTFRYVGDIALPVVGVFCITAGHRYIRSWTDYFDLGHRGVGPSDPESSLYLRPFQAQHAAHFPL